MARLLLESSRPEESAEGRVLLTRLVSSGTVNLVIVDLALKDAMARSAWAEAFPYISRLLEERRTNADLRNAYSVYRNSGSNDLALEVARELYERDTSNIEAAAIYASALIDQGQKTEASRVIDTRLPGMAGGANKSRFFFLRSRIRTDEESIMSDLRSSLFEDPRNLDALVAMLEIYRSRKDERRAVYYLKQALALAPEDPKLLRYREEFSAAMNATP
jgi:predicted Zn-dependent protease